VYGWVYEERQKRGYQKMSQNKSKFSGELKLQAIINLTTMDEQELGQYLRSNGLYRSQVEEWKREAQSLMSFKQTDSQKKINAIEKEKDHKIKQLEKDLRKKEKALAEASALLVLKKKANLIWGEEDD
jgi:carbamoylphosphate synthase small subunit